MTTAICQVEGLEIKYRTKEGTLTAIRNINFEVHPGEILGVVGESGSGKSTVASAVMQLMPPNGTISAGRILFQGQDLCKLDEAQLRELRGQALSMIFQDPMTSLNPVFTVEDQMMDAIMAHKVSGRSCSRDEARARAIEMLDRVGIPDAAGRIKDYPHQFSGGMRQRIMIAGALCSNPALLVADEPTSALDVTLEAQIIDLIRGLRDELGTAILYITHDLGVVAQLCDRVLVMYAGSVVESGDVFRIFDQPQHPYTRALLRSHPAHSVRAEHLATIRGRVPSLKDLPAGCKFAPRCDWARELCHEKEPLPTIQGQRVVQCHAIAENWDCADILTEGARAAVSVERHLDRAVSQDKVVETIKLTTYFRDNVPVLSQMLGRTGGVVRAVDGVTVTVRRGETLALVGESGSGKTTLGRTILRLEEPTDGVVFIQGIDISNLPQSKIRPLRAEMQMIFQDPISSLSPRKKVRSLLMEPFKVHQVPAEAAEKVDELLSMVGLSSEQADKYPHQLSGGQARRVGIARALSLHPKVLVADEPTAGLDVSVAAGILNLLKDLRTQFDLTYLIITHNLSVIGFIADRVAVMYLGKVVELAPTRELIDGPRHPYTQALISAISLPDPKLRGHRQRILLEGEIPSPRNPPPGCPFHPRCRFRQARCTQESPDLVPATGEHQVACWFPIG